MRRWWCAAGGLGRRLLSSSTSAVASHARPLPPPLIPKSPSFTVPFSLSCRRHHSLQGFFHPAIASSFRPPVSFRLIWFDFLLPYNADCLRGRCRAAVGASTAGAALRQGEIARAAHAHQIQSQEIQDQGPLVIAPFLSLVPFLPSRRAPQAADFMLLLLGP